MWACSPLLYLEKLHSDTSEHKLQQGGDDHDVANGPDGHKYTLDHMLQKHTVTFLLEIRSDVCTNKGTDSDGRLNPHT